MTLQQRAFLTSLRQEIEEKRYHLHLIITRDRVYPHSYVINLVHEIEENERMYWEKKKIYFPVPTGLSKEAEKRAKRLQNT
ncbi:hypothetical protein BQ9231_00186 [Cedratvirus lausannensis]|uniref:Uncharacterized protein n=1 Tax=Cedratvirus lausannensis TaxID=2023205 RepID=A0A285PWR9_9VIRU|nr:hypothetical protein BQ9231_00186 [Cedratvirus lausannensis]